MALKIGKIKYRPGLVLTGPFSGRDTVSQFNLSFAQELATHAKYELGLLSDNGPVADLKSYFDQLPRNLKCQIEHRLMPVLIPPDQGHWILMQPWEYGALPQDWQDLYRYEVDQVWVHTPNTYQAAIESGFPAERLALIPAGVNADTFNTTGSRLDLPDPERFRFLFIGDLLWVSGIDLLLQAFCDEFLTDEPVSLVIQDLTPHDSPGRQEILNQIAHFQESHPQLSILFMDRNLSAQERAALYRSCQVLVSPSRGDAFALTLIEAAACGLPICVTDLPGRFQFPDHPALHYIQARHLRHTQKVVGDIQTVDYPSWYEPNTADLRFKLRDCFQQYQKQEPQTELAHTIQQQFSWQASVELALQQIETVLEQPIFRQTQDAIQVETLKGLEALEQGDFENAEKHLKKALETQSEDPLILLDLAGLYLHHQKNQAALPVLEQALALAPGMANIYHAAGIALNRLEAWQLSALYFQRTLELQPKHQGAQESLVTANQQARRKNDRSANYPHWQNQLKTYQPQQQQLSLGLAMIVKDEGLLLRQCLESAQAFVDEIVIVDTGSTDQTLEIAQDFGAKISHFEWNGSFADARNAALEQVTSDWVLILDADEVLSPETAYNLRELMQIPQADLTGYQIKIRNLKYEASEGDAIEHYMVRLFPNHPQIRYKGLIHEQLGTHTDQLKFSTLASSDVLILHYGYSGEIMEQRDKYERNLKLLQTAIAAEPDNAFHWFNLGLTYNTKHKSQEALEALEKAAALSQEMAEKPNYISAVYSYLMSTLITFERYEDGLERAKQAPQICLESPDYWINLGTIYNYLNRFEEAIKAFEKAIQMRGKAYTAVVSDRAAMTWKPLVGIGNTYLLQQDIPQADHYFRRALKEAPDNPAILLGLGRLSLQSENYTDAQQYLEQAQNSDLQQQVHFELGRVASRTEDYALAEVRFQALLEQSLTPAFESAVKAELSQAYLKQGKIEEAKAISMGILDNETLFVSAGRYFYQQGAFDTLIALLSQILSENERAVFYRYRGIVHLKKGDFAAAQADFEAALQQEPHDAESRQNLAVIAFQNDDLDRAKLHLAAALQANPELYEAHLDLAKVAIHEERLADAEQSLAAARAIQPENIEIMLTQAFVAYRQEQLEAASSYYMDILELEPEHSEALIQLGYILNQFEFYDRALQLFERALATGADSIELYNGIGLAFLQSERYLEARNAFLLALEQAPENPELQKAVQMADQLSGQVPLESS